MKTSLSLRSETRDAIDFVLRRRDQNLKTFMLRAMAVLEPSLKEPVDRELTRRKPGKRAE
jgi:hypothetical protein